MVWNGFARSPAPPPPQRKRGDGVCLSFRGQSRDLGPITMLWLAMGGMKTCNFANMGICRHAKSWPANPAGYSVVCSGAHSCQRGHANHPMRKRCRCFISPPPGNLAPAKMACPGQGPSSRGPRCRILHPKNTIRQTKGLANRAKKNRRLKITFQGCRDLSFGCRYNAQRCQNF